MSDLPESLRELHRIHQQLSDLRERFERGPKQIRAREGNLTALQQALAKTQAELKGLRMSVDQKQLLLKSGEEKVKNLKTKLNQANNNREYQALKDQIAADEMAGSVLSDEILEGMDKVEMGKQAVAAAENDLATGKADLEKLKAKVREQAEALQAELTRVEGELKVAEEQLPADVRGEYQRLIKSKGADGMAALEGDACTGCYQHVTANMLNELQLARLVFCKGCGRLLYLPEKPVRAAKA